MKVSCDVIRDLLPLYTDQAASADTVALVEEHLASCPACREELGGEPAMEYYIGGVIAINAGPNLVGLVYRT